MFQRYKCTYWSDTVVKMQNADSPRSQNCGTNIYSDLYRKLVLATCAACLVSFGTEYCAGFVDVHGQWNNGFFCPKWGDPDIPYCCGDEHHRHCCRAKTADQQHPHLYNQQQQQPRYRHQPPPPHQQNDAGQTGGDLPPSQTGEHLAGPIYYQ